MPSRSKRRVQLTHQQDLQCSDDSDEDFEDAVALAHMLGQEGKAVRKARQRGKTYLTRADLPRTPRFDTSWEAVYHAKNDKAFIATTGFDVAGFHGLRELFEQVWNVTPIPRNDVNITGVSSPERRSLSAVACLSLVFYYVNSTIKETTLQEIFALTPTVANLYLTFGLRILRELLRRVPDADITWSRNPNQFSDYAAMIRMRHPLSQRGFCFVDGLNIPVAVSDDEDMQNAFYNDCPSVLAFAPDGVLLFCALNTPGSWNDAKVADDLYSKLIYDTPDGYFAIVDTAFPKSHARLRGRIMVPLKKNSKVARQLQRRGETQAFNQLLAENAELVSARQAAEWGMRSVQGGFSRLKIPLPAIDSEYRLLLLETCGRLHRFRARRVGINQVKTVYEKVWREGGISVYEQFERMIFKDIQSNDRIAQFYRTETELIDLDEQA